MKAYFRIFMILAVLLGLVGLARNEVAWAQPGTKSDPSVQAQDGFPTTVVQDDDDEEEKGTVHPPKKKVKTCKTGTFSVGGVAVLKVKRLAHNYCVTASLRKGSKDSGSIPAGAGSILAAITDVQFFYRNHRIGTLPASKGAVEICYAVPPGKQAQIYFREYGKKEWKPLVTSFKKGMACAPAQISGSYALIGK